MAFIIKRGDKGGNQVREYESDKIHTRRWEMRRMVRINNHRSLTQENAVCVPWETKVVSSHNLCHLFKQGHIWSFIFDWNYDLFLNPTKLSWVPHSYVVVGTVILVHVSITLHTTYLHRTFKIILIQYFTLRGLSKSFNLHPTVRGWEPTKT